MASHGEVSVQVHSQDVSFFGQTDKNLAPLGLLQVKCEGLLVAVDSREIV